jgi:hypothetical protein
LAAALAHAGILASGFEHFRVMIAEGVIGVVLAFGLLMVLIWPAQYPVMTLAVQGFALVGTLIGAFTIAVGVRPQT